MMSALAISGSVIIIALSFFLAALFEDPHAVQRGGSLLVVYSLYFVFRAHSIEAAVDEFVETRREGSRVGALSLEKLKEVLAVGKEIVRGKAAISANRAMKWHIGLGGVGEILHGWGDIIFRALPSQGSIH